MLPRGGFDPCRVDQQVQRPRSATVRDGDIQRLLAAAQSAEVRDFPVEPSQSQQAFDEPRRLPKGHTEKHLHRQANLDCCGAELGLTTAPTRRSRVPGHLGIKPD